MKRQKSFMCNCAWLNALMKLPDASRLKVYDAMFKYVYTGKVEGLTLVEEVSFDFIKADIDSSLEKYKERCKKNKENAEKRWEENENNGMQSHAIASNNNIKIKNKINDKDIPEQVQEVKYSSDEHTTLFGESDYSKFCLWLREHAPYLYKNCEHIITEKELIKLLSSYTLSEICEIIVNIENRKDKRKTYTNLYLTAFNWLKREYGKPSERPSLR